MSDQSTILLQNRQCSRIIRICFFSSEKYFIGFMAVLVFAYWIHQQSGDATLIYLLLFILLSNLELYREKKQIEKEEDKKELYLINSSQR